VLLFNGSMVLERASLTISQKLLRSRIGRSPPGSRTSARSGCSSRGSSRRRTRSATRSADQWSLLASPGQPDHRQADFYLHERVTFAQRWHGALRDWPGRLELAWAASTRSAPRPVLQAVLELRPSAPLTGSGARSLPQLEDPPAVGRRSTATSS